MKSSLNEMLNQDSLFLLSFLLFIYLNLNFAITSIFKLDFI